MIEKHLLQITRELGLQARQVAATAVLLEEGATVPFIARYRKEVTGYANDVSLTIAGGHPPIAMGTKWIGTDGWVWVDRSGFDAFLLVTVAASWKHVCYDYIFLVAALLAVPPSLLEAAAVDGAVDLCLELVADIVQPIGKGRGA